MNVDQVIAITAALCRPSERFRSRPYLCPAGVPTIGYGATYYQNGVRVTLTDPAITVEQAEALLQWHLRSVYLPSLTRLWPSLGTERRVAALLDFCFNAGTQAFAISRLRRYVLADRWALVPAELDRWNKSKGVMLSGLVARRAAEGALCA
jgi:lysozyme